MWLSLAGWLQHSRDLAPCCSASFPGGCCGPSLRLVLPKMLVPIHCCVFPFQVGADSLSPALHRLGRSLQQAAADTLRGEHCPPVLGGPALAWGDTPEPPAELQCCELPGWGRPCSRAASPPLCPGVPLGFLISCETSGIHGAVTFPLAVPCSARQAATLGPLPAPPALLLRALLRDSAPCPLHRPQWLSGTSSGSSRTPWTSTPASPWGHGQ